MSAVSTQSDSYQGRKNKKGVLAKVGFDFLRNCRNLSAKPSGAFEKWVVHNSKL